MDMDQCCLSVASPSANSQGVMDCTPRRGGTAHQPARATAQRGSWFAGQSGLLAAFVLYRIILSISDCDITCYIASVFVYQTVRNSNSKPTVPLKEHQFSDENMCAGQERHAQQGPMEGAGGDEHGVHEGSSKGGLCVVCVCGGGRRFIGCAFVRVFGG